MRACPRKPDRAECMALLRTDLPAVRSLQPGTPPPGYGPADIRSAYQLPVGAGRGRTVAIVNAFNYPTAESDLAEYRRTFGLPPCTTANGCFRKVYVTATGEETNVPPPVDSGWALESALDIDAVSAACRACNIVLVQAANDTFGALLNAVEFAREDLGAKFISMSWVDPNGENPVQLVLDQAYFNFPGIAFVAASGDVGGVVHWPAASQYVTAAGGTRLDRVLGRVPGPQFNRPQRWYESAWPGAGSGCSQIQPKPAWQTDPLCPQRTSADVSAVAEPATGLAVYTTTTTPDQQTGWIVVGGTSLSSPLIAAMYALAGEPGPNDRPNSYPYANRRAFWDIDMGITQNCPTGTYLCRAVIGYDGPTGVGSPRGVRGLRP
ncbi:S8 family serine peptidase [Streptomyces sp. NPDC090445]|uniref:S53 family peptidase n=1 Tax=Streptomyces sp. NPDC090445 TaxID=3365963 RepID=UPI0037FD614A